MLFNSGTPSLFSLAARYSGDPRSVSANDLYPEQEIKDALNLAYVELMGKAKMRALDLGNKRCYTDSVKDQVFYQKPDDFEDFVSVEIAADGSDLSSVSPNAEIAIPDILNGREGLLAFENDSLSASNQTLLWVFEHGEDHYGITPPPDTAGTNSIRLTYKASTVHLSGNTDEPFIPRDYQELISLKAAIRLKVGTEDDFQDILFLMAPIEERFNRFIQQRFSSRSGSFPLKYRPPTSGPFKTGYSVNNRRI